jgi:hypothetical protein
MGDNCKNHRCPESHTLVFIPVEVFNKGVIAWDEISERNLNESTTQANKFALTERW